MKAEYLKCACANCGHVIEYLPAAAGTVVACPKCKEESQLPPLPKPAPAGSPAEPDGPEIRRCRGCNTVLGPTDAQCPACSAKRHRQQMIIVRSLAIAAGLAVVAIAIVAVPLVRSKSPRSRTSNAPVPTQPVTIPQPRVRLPKSTNDFNIGRFTVDKRGDVTRITGDIENTSENLYRQLRVDFDLLDAQGVKVGVLSDTIVELPPRQTWHIILSTSDSRAARVRVTALREQ